MKEYNPIHEGKKQKTMVSHTHYLIYIILLFWGGIPGNTQELLFVLNSEITPDWL